MDAWKRWSNPKHIKAFLSPPSHSAILIGQYVVGYVVILAIRRFSIWQCPDTMDITDLFYVLKYPMNCFLVQICIQNTCAMRSSIIVMPNRWYLQTNDCQNEEQWTITFMEIVVIIWTVKVRPVLSRFKHSSNDLILLFYHR